VEIILIIYFPDAVK